MAKYKKVRCIAFCIKPGTRDEGGNVVYLGQKSAELDIQKRCTIMKNAVMTAYDELDRLVPQRPPKLVPKGSMAIMGADPVLTVFMAPEFFFRGADGAYPIEKISTILPQMAKTVQDPKYKDWLFVYGTAIGYQKLDETITKIAGQSVENNRSYLIPDSLPEKKFLGWNIVQYAQTSVKKVQKIGGDQFRLSLATKDDVGWCNRVSLIHGPQAVRTEEFDILAREVDGGNAAITVRARSTPIEAGWTAELLFVPSALQQVATDHEFFLEVNVLKVSPTGDGTVHVTLGTTVEPAVGWGVSFVREDKTETNIFTISKSVKDPDGTTITISGPDQKRQAGCPSPSCGCPEFVPHRTDPVRCGNCSHFHMVDPIRAGWTAKMKCRYFVMGNDSVAYTPGRFLRLRNDPASAETEVFNIALVQRGGAGAREILVYKQQYSQLDFLPGVVDERKSKIHGEERTLADTEAMADPSKGVDSDIGGAPVFDIDGCTVGLEICLDHGRGRLETYFAGGGTKPQVLLIPSWGMRIGLGPVCGQDGAVVFNVDGQQGDSVVRIFDGTYGCDLDLKLASATEEYCPKCMLWYCPNCNSFDPTPDGTDASGCATCGGPLDQPYYCQKHWQFSSGPGQCTKCNKQYKLYDEKYKKIGPVVRELAGPLTVKLRSWGDWLTVTQTNYFLGKGSIVIYPEKPIPNA